MNAILRSFAGPIARAPRRIMNNASEWRKRRHCHVDMSTVLLPTARIENHLGDASAISVGKRCRIGGELLVFAHGGKISIGNDCFVGEGSRIWSACSVSIGSRVLISHGVNIHDTNSHPLSAIGRHKQIIEIFNQGHPAALSDVSEGSVVIEDDAWIGFNAAILKGVHVGKGAVIGAATVVLSDVPAYAIVVGNPARCVGEALP